MTSPDIDGRHPITALSASESLALLGEAALGRVVVVIKGRAEIFPVNYAVGDGKVYFRTAEGTKLFGVAANDDVLFEVDHVEDEGGWSIILRGSARRLEGFREINDAEELDLRPWVPTLKYNFVEITPETISGRRFEFGEEPERYTGA